MKNKKGMVMFSAHAKERLRERAPWINIKKFCKKTKMRIDAELKKGAEVNVYGELRIEVVPTVWVACYPSLLGGWEIATVFREGDSVEEIRYAGLANIELAELDLHGLETGTQAAQVLAEWKEFMEVQVGEVKIERVTEEAFDLIQALYGYMRKLGVDVKKENRRHLRKMRERHERRA